jgi:uroporphyrinogen decarboxylase
MNKRTLMLDLARGRPTPGYVPAAFFLHFDPDHHRGQAAVDRHLEFFRATGMDFVKIQYEHAFPSMPGIRQPRDWGTVPPLRADHFTEPLAVVDGIVKAVGREAVVVVTLYSALMLAGQAVGRDRLTAHLEEDPERTAQGLRTIAESLLVFVRECAKRGVDGFYASTQGGEAGRFTDPALFVRYVKPSDLLVMEEINRLCHFNILHVCDYHGAYESLAAYQDYPGHIVNCGTVLRSGPVEPRRIASLFHRPFMGGMDRHGIIGSGDRKAIQREARGVIGRAPSAFILGADCTVSPDTPWDKLRAAIAAAHTPEG